MRLNLIERSLYRFPLRLVEAEGDYHRSWDLGYHHAHRGKESDPDNPAVADKEAYLAGYKQSKGELAKPDRSSTADRPEQDVEPVMRLGLHDVPKSVSTVASAINAAGGRALLIGGSVRDKLMGISPKDFDIEVYGLDPDRLEQELSKLGQVDSVGKSFGVMKLVVGEEDFDVSVPRRESKVGAGHKGFIPKPDPTMTIKEAARRRDFTMNTVAMDPHTGDVFDPYGGVNDIKNKLLRATDPTAFIEDPLRILRGAQFASRFKMSVEPDTMGLMQQASHELVDLPKERVGGEWRKLLLKGVKPSLGMDVMKEAGVLKALHPELDAMSDTPQDPEWHPEGDVWTHTKMVTDRAAEITKGMSPEIREVVLYSALMHDIAKPDTTFTDVDGRVRSPRHEEEGGKKVAEIFRKQFDVSKELAEKVANITTDHLKPMVFYNDRDKLTEGALRRLARRLAPASIEELVHTAHADHTGRGESGPQDFPAGAWLMDRANELEIGKEPPKPILMGRHLIPLGVKPGPGLGKILNKVFDMQIDGQVKDLDSAIRAAKDIIGTQHDESIVLPRSRLRLA